MQIKPGLNVYSDAHNSSNLVTMERAFRSHNEGKTRLFFVSGKTLSENPRDSATVPFHDE